MSIPYHPISIDFKTDEEEVNNQIKIVCRSLLPGWSDVPDESYKFSKISGGISNILVKADPSGFNGLSPVAVKVFGDKTELLIDREVEKTVLVQLNQHGFGAKVLAFFENGRIEAFIPCKTLVPDEMSDAAVVPYIARRLAAFHALPIDLSGTPATTSGTSSSDPVFRVIRDWLNMASQLSFDHDAKKASAFSKMDLESMHRDVDELETLSRRIQSPIVFAHCDLLSGNILIVSSSSSYPVAENGSNFTQKPAAELLSTPADYAMQFIDFEYSCFTTRGFDLGNHFNEYAGFDCDYTKYPNAEQQAIFLQNYLSVETGHMQGDKGEKGEEEDKAKIKNLSQEANFYALVSHVYWGVWALIQARYSAIDFDYLEYSELRWGEFRRRREEFMAPIKAL
uniref:ethanolamine kinase n=1 Tax=Polytomella parva TaxID=51329 RepID=A0A7S0VNF9_9CHLO|mmetsp:Transcript_7876/g.15343  ORF Transcript_7876/g.15343 Transcript_7876/m.15343 type:complete len:396 (+) Transcript_7876:68-1255(+)